ncbi:uncharacterized protein EV420DRAFT_703161 [Desarmillaria tabescens]|uniref:F-box domain-containing protein n=1 Tax=Armillaria tabescens TaxID=1929756 RepID=A0AA39K4H6_ARMTA|nr:uncharacterized protein EV420DRAFT_703161 [Desarmillaria tabescens]KAK0452023.1 hypothetical protein EV420DRAFT_703161 [Desarmillaria tabescens]
MQSVELDLSVKMPDIPIEIIEEILDHLRSDKQMLKVCSLVLRSFYPRTRHYLFQFIRISDILGDSMHRLRVLARTSPHIFIHFNSAEIHSSYDPSTLRQVQLPLFLMANLTSLSIKNTSTSLKCFRTIIFGLPLLKSLILESSIFDVEDTSDLPSSSIIVNKPCLEKLHIHHLHSGLSDFLPFVFRYRDVFLESLQEFYINMYNLRGKDLSLCCDIIRAASQFRTLKSLHVLGTSNCLLTQWFDVKPLFLPLRLKSLSFDINYRALEGGTDISAMQWFLNAFPDSPQLRYLENLRIDMSVKTFDDFADEDEIWVLFAHLGSMLSLIETFWCLQLTYICDYQVTEEIKCAMLSLTLENLPSLRENDVMKISLHGTSVA